MFSTQTKISCVGNISISMGVCQYKEGEKTIDQFIHRVDQLMYEKEG